MGSMLNILNNSRYKNDIIDKTLNIKMECQWAEALARN